MRDPQTNRSADEMAAALEGDCVGFRWRSTQPTLQYFLRGLLGIASWAWYSCSVLRKVVHFDAPSLTDARLEA